MLDVARSIFTNRRGLLRCALRITILGLSLVVGSASQDASARPLCRLERPVLHGKQLHVLATQVTVDGNLQQETAWSLPGLGGSPASQPLQQRTWVPEDAPISFLLLVEASVAYAPASESLRAALKLFLSALPRESHGQLWTFAEQTEGLIGFRPPVDLFAEAARYRATAEGELRLLPALRRAQAELSKAPSSSRRALVLISDGRNTLMDHQEFYAIGEELGRAEQPVYALGFSPRDIRGPLRNLGDLAKRSGGTFRWARTHEDLGPQIVALALELRGAQMLSFDGSELAKQDAAKPLRIRLRCGEGSSNFCRVRIVPGDRTYLWLGSCVLFTAGSLLIWRRRQQRRPAITGHKLLAGVVPSPPPPAEPVGPALVAEDGRRFAIGECLSLGIGLDEAGSLSLGSGAAQVLCVVWQTEIGYKLLANSPAVRLNYRLLVGAMGLHDGDRIGIEGLGEWFFRET